MNMGTVSERAIPVARSALAVLVVALTFIATIGAAQRTSAPGDKATPDVGIRVLDINDGDRTLGLIWHVEVVPGDELLFLKNVSKRYGISYYSRYRFVGIRGGSIEFQVSETSQEGSSQAKPLNDSPRTVFVERAEDGQFYFIAENLKDVGTFRIRRNETRQGAYVACFA